MEEGNKLVHGFHCCPDKYKKDTGKDLKPLFECRRKHYRVLEVFFSALTDWHVNKGDIFKAIGLTQMDEWTPFYCDVDSEAELCNILMEIKNKGTESYTRQFIGDYFYRSDCEECPRCRRYRPELGWAKVKKTGQELCDRCTEVMKSIEEDK